MRTRIVLAPSWGLRSLGVDLRSMFNALAEHRFEKQQEERKKLQEDGLLQQDDEYEYIFDIESPFY